jgi:hypothetical protein
MQNRYVGDIGDFVKFAILRGLSPGKRLGVAWWLFPDGGPVGDGKHISYLRAPAKWRHLDPQLFDALGEIIMSNRRHIHALENADLLPRATFFSEAVRAGATPGETRADRQAWFARCQTQLTDCDLVFLDPDNGLETTRFSTGTRAAGKSVALAELSALRRPGRTIIVYHHQTRRIGGHVAELGYWSERLRAQGFDQVDALRASPWSARAFFLLDADQETRTLAAALADRWNGMISWHANGGETP